MVYITDKKARRHDRWWIGEHIASYQFSPVYNRLAAKSTHPGTGYQEVRLPLPPAMMTRLNLALPHAALAGMALWLALVAGQGHRDRRGNSPDWLLVLAVIAVFPLHEWPHGLAICRWAQAAPWCDNRTQARLLPLRSTPPPMTPCSGAASSSWSR
jgi:hypothetical protein